MGDDDPACNENGDGDENPLSFDEYKLYYETTEKVTERRIVANRWNYSVCEAIIAGISVLVGWCSSRPNLFAFATAAVVVFSICGALFCGYWLREITSAKLLNGAKFDVLNAMAKRIRFENSEAQSYEPFAREWTLVEKSEGARRIKGLRDRLALSSSGAELFTPRVFRFLFVLIAVATLVAAIVSITLPVTRIYLPLAPPSPPAVSQLAPLPAPIQPGGAR